MINIYDYHSEPNKLDQYDNRLTIVSELAYCHAKMTQQRFEAGEYAIMNSPSWAYLYAKDIIKDRWPEAEPVIMTDPKYAYYYTIKIIKGRWEAAEPVIMKDSEYWIWYNQYLRLGGALR